MPLSIRSADQANQDLADHLLPLGRLMDEAHEEFQRECRGLAHKLEMRTKASMYRDLIVRNLRDYCDVTAGATTIKKGQLVLVGINNRWVLRVKRLGKGFSVAVSPTAASRDYDGNQVPASIASLFPDDDLPTCIYFGWSVAENAPGSIAKYLVCNDSNRELLWTIPLGGSLPPPSVTEELPLAPVAPAPTHRVRVKATAKRKVNE